MTFSFAAIPLPVLIGVPVLGLVAAVIIYEVEKSRKAAAAAAAATAALSQPIVASAPAGATGPVTAGSTAAAATGRPVVGIKKGGVTTWLPGSLATGEIAFSTPASNAATTGYGPQIVAAAKQALAAVPSPYPNDPYGINAAVVKASLGQLIQNPTAAQLGTTMSDLQQNNTPPASAAYATIARVYQVMAA